MSTTITRFYDYVVFVIAAVFAMVVVLPAALFVGLMSYITSKELEPENDFVCYRTGSDDKKLTV